MNITDPGNTDKQNASDSNIDSRRALPPLDELIAIGPLKIRVKLPRGITGKSAALRVSNEKVSADISGGCCRFTIKSILDHEMVIIT